MKDLSRKIAIISLSVAIISNIGVFSPLLVPSVKAATNCSEWSLLYVTSDAVTGVTKNSLVSSFYPNQIVEGDKLFSSSTPPDITPLTIPDNSYWACTQTHNPAVGSTISTGEDKKQAQGTEDCQKAVKLAAKFGGYTAIDENFSSKIQKGVLENINTSLKKSISNATNIKLDFLTTTGLIDKAGDFIQSGLDKLIGNPLKDGVSKKAEDIANAAKEEANRIARNLGIFGLTGEGGITSMVNSLGVDTEVPVFDKKIRDAIDNNIGNLIAEQKKQQVIQDTRDKCNNLLKTTVATIKKALLYQLSTQITDWIMTGKEPQFIKQPGKFLEDTGRLALDRFISNVAPQLCQPFRLDVQIQIPSVTRHPFYEQVRCTLDQVTNNINNFYKDFRQGGWLTYQEVLKPQNNYYGASLMVQSAAQAEAMNAVSQAQTDITQGRGFKSQTRCVFWTKYEPIRTVNFRQADKMQDGVSYTIENTAEAQESGGPPENGLVQSDVRPSQWFDTNGNFWECQNYENTTPGTVAANLSEKANSTDLDYLANSDDIENFLETIQDSIVNKLVKSGVGGLQKLIQGLPKL